MQLLIRQLSNARSRYFLTYSGVNLEYRQKGEHGAETIVMLHGAGTDCRIFLPNIDPLAEEYQVLAVSLRGHGLSDKPKEILPESFTKEVLMRDLIELTWSLGIQQFHFLGHGLGGLIGYELLRHDPNSLLSLATIAAPASSQGLQGAIKLLSKMTSTSSNLFFNHKRKAESAAKMCSTNAEVIAFLKDEVFYATAWDLANQFKREHKGENYLELLKNSPCPVLLLEGKNDPIEKRIGYQKAMKTTFEYLRDAAQVVIVKMEDAGYFPQLDQPQRFHELYSSFLSAHTS